MKPWGFVICLGVYTNSYHLHVTTLEIAFETSIGRWLGLEVCIVTTIAVVRDIIDGDLLFGVHDGGKMWCEVKEV